MAESFTNQREATTTMSTSLGLVRLLKEHGISAAVYNPYSWDRMSSFGANPYGPKSAIRPSTPPSSPLQSLCPSPPPFEFKGASSHHYDNFLASKPARSILKEIRGDKRVRNSECQTDVSISKINLVDKVKRLGIAKAVHPGTAIPTGTLLVDERGSFLPGAQGPLRAFTHGTLVGESTCPETSTIGGIQLNSSIRRNRSFPTMVGASMQMKGPATLGSGILMGAKLPKQTSLR